MITAKDMFYTLEKLQARTRELEAFRFVDLATIAPMISMEGQLGADDVYHGMPEKIEGGQMNIGDEFVGLDRYLWVQKTVTLPEHMDGREVYGLFNFGKTGGGHNNGFESLLYIDGHPAQGIDTNHNDVNLEAYAGKTVTLTFMLWTGLNGVGPKVNFRHRISQADIGYLHSDTDELYYLAKAIFKTLKIMDEDDVDRPVLSRALDHAFDLIDWDADCFYDTVGDALAALKADLAGTEKRLPVTVNVVGHTHIDVAWMWRLKHTREKAMRSFATVIKLMDEFDEYIFLQTQPQLYKYIKQDCPELYEKIRQHVAEGRWETDGGMWLEADCNLSSGEALVRQFLHGIRFFQQEFGHKCEYLWLPDVFGYSWALPQILRGVGINTFMTTKISWNQYDTMPNDLFKWRGIDGSEVMGYFITAPEVGRSLDDRYSTYNSMISPRAVVGSWKKFRNKNLSNETLISYCYGDGGGGVNRNMLKMRRAMDQLPGLPKVKPTRAADFFRRMHENIENTPDYVATWDGELYLEYHRGTYTSQAYNKMMNRRLEFALAECEWLSSMAMLAGGEYAQQTLTDGWETVLRNQFHDIIPGSSIGEVYADCHREYGEVAEDLAHVTRDALSTLAVPEQDAWMLWHSGSFARRDVISIDEYREGVFRDAKGNVLPSQRVNGGYRVEVELLPLSATTIRFTECAVPAKACPFAVDMDARTIATPCYQAAWDENGQFTRLYDVENNREVLPSGAHANVLRVFEDKPLPPHDNWDIDLYHILKSEPVQLVKAPELIECGELRVVLRFEYAYRHSTFVQDVIFYADNRRIDFQTKAEWHESHRLLKASFPVDVRSTKATYDIQFGHVERPTHFNTSWDYARFEVCAHKWADLSEEGYGVSLLNDCKYGHSIKDNVMNITLLKSGKFPDENADMGHHSFTYALLPHTGSVASGDTIEESIKLNLPIRVRRGVAGELLPAFTCNSRSVHIDAIKKAEDSDNLIVRFHECRGSHADIELTPSFPIRAYAPCNLLEEPTGEPTTDSVLRIHLRPFELCSVTLHPLATALK